MRYLKNLFFVFVLSILSFQLSAHGYWIELEGNRKVNKPIAVKIYFGDYPVGERLSGKTLDKMKDIKVYVTTPSGEKQAITMTQKNDFWEGSFTPRTKGTYQVTGVNDEREVQDWAKHHLGVTRPIQYLKAIYTIGKASNVHAGLYLDAYIKKLSEGNFEIHLSKEGDVLPKQKFVVAEFDKGENEFITDENGKVVIKLDNPGLYILSVDWVDTTPGTFKGKEYESVRHRLDIALEN